MKNPKYIQFYEAISKTKKSKIKNPSFMKYFDNQIKNSDLQQFDKNCLLRYLKA